MKNDWKNENMESQYWVTNESLLKQSAEFSADVSGAYLKYRQTATFRVPTERAMYCRRAGFPALALPAFILK